MTGWTAEHFLLRILGFLHSVKSSSLPEGIWIAFLACRATENSLRNVKIEISVLNKAPCVARYFLPSRSVTLIGKPSRFSLSMCHFSKLGFKSPKVWHMSVHDDTNGGNWVHLPMLLAFVSFHKVAVGIIDSIKEIELLKRRTGSWFTFAGLSPSLRYLYSAVILLCRGRRLFSYTETAIYYRVHPMEQAQHCRVFFWVVS